jgi:hypothetical protein
LSLGVGGTGGGGEDAGAAGSALGATRADTAAGVTGGAGADAAAGAPAGGGASGADDLWPASWHHTVTSQQRVTILQLRGRTTRDLRTLAPVIPTASPTDVTTPGPEFERDSGGRLTAAARLRWNALFQVVTDTLVRDSQAKESSVKKRLGNIGILESFLVGAGFGTHFREVESGSGVWEPALDDDGVMVKLDPMVLAFYLSVMGNGGRGRTDKDGIVLLGACAQPWLRARCGCRRTRCERAQP